MTGRASLATGIAIALATCAIALRPEPGGGERRSPAVAIAPADTSTELRLLLNVPAYRLDVIERGTVTRSIRVAVGQRQYRTPLGHFRIDYTVWNPWWRPPDSYWARKERPQAPGWDNPVGRVKLHVTELVFLHGTPFEESLGSAASHACVRMANADAIALARTVHRYAGPSLAPGTLDSLEADTARTRTIALAQTVPIDVVYRIAEVGSGELRLHPDVYRLVPGGVAGIEREAVAALLRAGIDTAGMRSGRLRELARASRRGAVGVPLDSLRASEPPTAANPDPSHGKLPTRDTSV
ncbi:MAG TPA: L,D-transpeptidase family protein [Gemmatimonadaceae bacterium]|nr:L,D-transpeptidase family protein [Gemmatimonadaceae bacterium]